jgi:hypothetical protein
MRVASARRPITDTRLRSRGVLNRRQLAHKKHELFGPQIKRFADGAIPVTWADGSSLSQR